MRSSASGRPEYVISNQASTVVHHHTRGGTLRGYWVPQHAASEFRGRVGRAGSRPNLHRRRRRGLRAQGSNVKRSRAAAVVCCMLYVL